MQGLLSSMQGRTAQELAYIAMSFLAKNITNIVSGIIIFAIGWLVAKFVGNLIKFLLIRRKADVTITKFLVDIIKFLIIFTALLIILGNFGITITPLIAGLGALGFGVSFALQGPLSNYAAGATLVFTKPFKIGDILEVGNFAGEIVDMTLARTVMKTLDGTRIIIPNKKIIGEIMHNYSEYKKLDLKIGIAYSSDVDKAINIVKDCVKRDARVVPKPQAKIGISEFADSSIVIYARLWCKQSDYWDAMFDINRAVFESFGKAGIAIPFPQRDIHIRSKES